MIICADLGSSSNYLNESQTLIEKIFKFFFKFYTLYKRRKALKAVVE